MSLETNKEIVRRFNVDVIQGGRREVFEELMAADFVNRSAPAGMPCDRDSMWNTFENVLRPAFSDFAVTIHDQIAEGDKVTTRKTFTGRHTGAIFGIAPTGKSVSIDVIDIVRIRDGQYAEHWGINSLAAVVASLQQA
jgi:predicted ester cyclase